MCSSRNQPGIAYDAIETPRFLLIASAALDGMSKSQVSALASTLDSVVDDFRNRPLDQGPYTYVWVDALAMKCREGGRIVNVAVVVATGVNAEGSRGRWGADGRVTRARRKW